MYQDNNHDQISQDYQDYQVDQGDQDDLIQPKYSKHNSGQHIKPFVKSFDNEWILNGTVCLQMFTVL